jgi:TatD DNase family protein
MLIDTHTHIYLDEFNDDRNDVILRAKSSGVRHMILPNVDRETIPGLLNLEQSDPHFFHAAMGLHPTSVNEKYLDELALMKAELDKRPYCAIGEIGMDLYWDKTFRQEQIEAFETQLKWAIDLNVPVIIHVRNAFFEALESVKKLNNKHLRGVFHSFSGSLEIAKEIMKLDGFMLGINGVVTFKNAKLPDVLAQVPLDYLVLETDAPYLTPAPYRGKRNEPAYLTFICEKLAEIYHTSSEEIIKKTGENALEVFNSIIFAND